MIYPTLTGQSLVLVSSVDDVMFIITSLDTHPSEINLKIYYSSKLHFMSFPIIYLNFACPVITGLYHEDSFAKKKKKVHNCRCTCSQTWNKQCLKRLVLLLGCLATTSNTMSDKLLSKGN